MLEFFKPKSATDGAKKSPVLMDSSSGGDASGDADVVVTGVVSRGEGDAFERSGAHLVVTGVVSKGEGGAGAGSFPDLVATEVVKGLEDFEGAGIDTDGVFLTLQTALVPPIGRLSTLPSTARGCVRLSGSLFSNTTHQLPMVLPTRGCRGRLG